MTDEFIEEQAKRLRAGSQRAKISSIEPWDAIGLSRQGRWKQLAKGLLEEGNCVISIASVIAVGEVIDVAQEFLKR